MSAHLLYTRMQHTGNCWCAGVCTGHRCHSHWCRGSGKSEGTPQLLH